MTFNEYMRLISKNFFCMCVWHFYRFTIYSVKLHTSDIFVKGVTQSKTIYESPWAVSKCICTFKYIILIRFAICRIFCCAKLSFTRQNGNSSKESKTKNGAKLQFIHKHSHRKSKLIRTWNKMEHRKRNYSTSKIRQENAAVLLMLLFSVQKIPQTTYFQLNLPKVFPCKKSQKQEAWLVVVVVREISNIASLIAWFPSTIVTK